MTNDLISREAAAELLRDKAQHYTVSMFATSGECHVARVVATEAVSDIESIPAVDAVPVVHGRWIEKQEAVSWCDDDIFVFYECSICHDQDGIYSDKFNYCPNCGAKMDKEDEDAKEVDCL